MVTIKVFSFFVFSASMIEISNSIGNEKNMKLNQNVNVFKFGLKYEIADESIACAQILVLKSVCVLSACVYVQTIETNEFESRSSGFLLPDIEM